MAITDFPFRIGPINNITPFTYRDGVTYLEILYLLRDYINDTLRPEFDGEMERIIEEFNAGIENAENHFTEYKTNIDAAIAAFEAGINADITAHETAVDARMDTAEADINTAKTGWQTLFDQFMANVEAEIAVINNAVIDNRISQSPFGHLASFYGIVGDGVADDTAGFQDLLDSTASANVKAVLNPGMVLKISSARITVPSNTHLDGNGATIRNALTASTSDALLWIHAGTTDVLIENLNIDGDKAAYAPATEWKHGISITGGDKITLRNVFSYLNKGDGIYVGGDAVTYSKNIVLENVHCDQNHRQGLSIVGVSGLKAVNSRFTRTAGTNPQSGLDIEPNTADSPIEKIQFINCEFTDNTNEGIDLAAWKTRTIKQGDVDFIGCVVSGNGVGVKMLTGDNIRFTGGVIKNNVGHGVWFSAFEGITTEVSFNGTEIVRNGGAGIRMDVGCQGFRLNNVLAYGNTTAAAGIGVDLIPVADRPATRVVIANSVMGGSSQTHGLRTTANVNNLTLSGNSYPDVATAVSLADDVATRFRAEKDGYSTRIGAAASTSTSYRVTGDAFDRLAIRFDGSLYFGDGATAVDTTLFRAGVDSLRTTDLFTADLGLVTSGRVRVGQYTTANRRAANLVGQGSIIFDTDLGKPIYVHGTTWKDFAGNAV
jgi:hypothetical protein